MPRPDVLVRVDEAFESVAGHEGDEGVEEVDVIRVVDSRPSVLEGLPGDYEADKSESPLLQSREVVVPASPSAPSSLPQGREDSRLLERERSAYKRDSFVVEEAVCEVREAVGLGGELVEARNRAATDEEGPVMLVLEVPAVRGVQRDASERGGCGS